MHNCRRMENQFVDLLFEEPDAERRLRLLAELESCAECLDQYASLSDTLLVVERAAGAASPSEAYWQRYDATLKARLAEVPTQAFGEREPPARLPFWKRLLTARLPLPLPVAAALVLGLVITSALALRQTGPAPAAVAPPPLGTVKFVEVPVVQEKFITRTVYVEKKQATERAPRARTTNTIDPARALGDGTVANNRLAAETGFFTRANLKGFQPADEMKIRVIKRNTTDEK